MRVVGFVAQRRLARHWRALLAAGVLLGLGFGLCLSSFAAARSTASAYHRILAAADAPDAAVALGQSPEQSERSLRSIKGIIGQRVYAGFLGTADGVDHVLTTALLAPIHDRFPIELPQLQAGRLPHPDAPDEVIVNRGAAERGHLEVGQRLHFHFFNPSSSKTADAEITIVGIGTMPAEAVVDETNVVGVFVFTRAFYDAHRDLTVYATSNVDLAPGFDARRDLAAKVGALGHQLQSARVQEQQSVNDALRPLLIVLVALGVLAFGATAVATAQVAQRNRDRVLSDDARLHTMGMSRRQIRAVELTTAGVVAAVAVVTALFAMVLASAAAPIGPLHDLDPAQGFAIDGAVAAAGAAAIVATIVLLTLAFSSVRRPTRRPASRQSPWVNAVPGSAATVAGLSLAFRTRRAPERVARGRSDDGRGRGARAVRGVRRLGDRVDRHARPATASTPTYSRSMRTATSLRLRSTGRSATSDDVVAATGFTSGSFLVKGRAVPGLAATRVKGELTPTILRGRGPACRRRDRRRPGHPRRHRREARRPRARADPDRVRGRRRTRRRRGEPAHRRRRDVPGGQPGRHRHASPGYRCAGQPIGVPAHARRRRERAGVHGGAAGRRRRFRRRCIARNPAGFQDATQSTTTWFTDTKPAELRQLDAAMPYLSGALVVGFLILLAVIAHALWTRSRNNRHDLAVLRVIGYTRASARHRHRVAGHAARTGRGADRHPDRRRTRTPGLPAVCAVIGRCRRRIDFGRRSGPCSSLRCCSPRSSPTSSRWWPRAAVIPRPSCARPDQRGRRYCGRSARAAILMSYWRHELRGPGNHRK